MAKPGEDFEVAVERFARTLDPSANVYRDYKVPDRDTGTLRQCDVWIDARFGGHYPLSILVSCKDWGEKLDIGDIGTFCNEVRSTCASFGVIYSRAGFTQPAIAKAKSNGIVCCRLYQNQPADLPLSIPLWWHYTATPRLALDVVSGRVSELDGARWGDLFKAIPGLKENLEQAFYKLEDHILHQMKETMSAPVACYSEHAIGAVDSGELIRIRLSCGWRRYRARAEAVLLNGSYCYQNHNFTGTVTGPSVDMESTEPGSGWEELQEQDTHDQTPAVWIIPHRPNVQDGLRQLEATQLW
jgi:hypothetical protein